MDYNRPWRRQRWTIVIIALLLYGVTIISGECSQEDSQESHIIDSDDVDIALRNYVDEVLHSVEQFTILPGVEVEKIENDNKTDFISNRTCNKGRSARSIQSYVSDKIDDYARTHVLAVRVPETARFLIGADAGKSSFLTGFGMGFMAFALKKLLLPFFIGAQLLKSVLIAMFLPSILGSVGKLLGKGLSTFSGISGASTGINNPNQQVEDFEFKDTSPYDNEPGNLQEYQGESDTLQLNVASSTEASSSSSSNSRFGIANNRVSYTNQMNDNYYMRKPNKKTDYKVFHKIPTSSLLLTSYDPFYSPLLSRLDAVFQQLGLGNDKSPQTEKCRERLVCLMYANPAKYAPYSNLVSAQLSRELNELKKPTSDNPDILRFFRYMKAAKDGQDGEECLAHGGCPSLTKNQPSPAILTTFNEINKLVQARKLK